MPVQTHQSSDQARLETSNLRLVFQLLDDRWTHTLELQSRQGWLPIARAVEAEANRFDLRRLLSPAFQQLQLQEDGPKAQGLLIGEAGPHRFSAVFEVEEGAEGESSVTVEVADRCRVEVSALASTYVVDRPSGDLIEADESRLAWNLDAGRLTFEAISPTRADLHEAGRRATHAQAAARLQLGKPTHQWSYRWIYSPSR